VGLFLLMLGSGLLSAVLLFAAVIILFLIYASAAVAAFIETMFGSVFRILKI
jgi:hypothetical protein